MIFKPKIKKLLQTFSIFVIALVCTLTINTLPTHATTIQDVANAIADLIGVSGSGESAIVPEGIAATRTGYLCYILEANGNNPGLDAYAFKSNSEFTDLPGAINYIRSRRGHTVTGWKSDDPVAWNIKPFNRDKSTNQAAIKAWMTSNETGTVNVVKFVSDNWGNEVAIKFKQGEYILVVETLLHFQFSFPSEHGTPDYFTTLDVIHMIHEGGEEIIDMINDLGMSINDAAVAIRDILNAKLDEMHAGTSYVKVGSPVIGTPANCLDFYDIHVASSGPNWFKEYLNKIVPFAEMITPGGAGEKAGFTPWTGATSAQISDADIDNHGLAMFVIKAIPTIQTTCDETITPYTPHPAPDESDGTYTIVKNYRLKTSQGTYEDTTPDPSYTENLAPSILIENESEYQVVGWKTSATVDKNINSTTWESSVPSPVRSGTTPTTVTLTPDTEKCLYVLLEKIEPPDHVIEDANYILSQSSITRRVWFSNPDHRLTNMDDTSEKIEEREFAWSFDAFAKCGGHEYQAPCEGHPHRDNRCQAGCEGGHSSTDYCCLEGCTSDHNCGKSDCVTKTDYCGSSDGTSNDGTHWKLSDDSVRLSINNVKQGDNPNVLATKDGWNKEVEKGNTIKRYFNGRRTQLGAGRFIDTRKNWDYVCILMRGADKLTVAHEDSGQRKPSDYIEIFIPTISIFKSDLIFNLSYINITSNPKHNRMSVKQESSLSI